MWAPEGAISTGRRVHLKARAALQLPLLPRPLLPLALLLSDSYRERDPCSGSFSKPKPRALSGSSHVAAGAPGPRAVRCCFPRHTSRELEMEHLGLELVVPLWDAPCCCTALLPCCLVPEVLSFESRENGPSFSPATNVNHGQDWTGLKPGTRNPAQVLLAGVGAQAVLCCLPGCACAGSWRWAPAGGTCAAGLHHPLLSSVNEAGLARRRPLAPRGRLGTGDSVSSGRRRAAARWPGGPEAQVW